jgi:DNA-binding CsgD family transcriptional regulator
MGQLIDVEGGLAPALLDREPELASLTGWLSEARQGRGKVALVLGGAGLGKTAFVQRSVALARAQGLVALKARGGELERDMPFGVARQLFEKTIRELQPAEQREVMTGPASGVRSLLGMVDGGVATADPLGAIHALYWLLANLSDHAPLVLAIDDLHWADPQTVRWLSYLTGRVAELPVLVLAAARPTHPGGRHPMPEVMHATEMIGLRPLGVGAVGEMVRDQFNRAGEDGFISACHQATGGNPFFVKELLRAALSDGVEPIDSHRTTIPELGPQQVAQAILVRLARLGERPRQLAQSVAVLGADAELRHAAALTRISVFQALDVWDELVRAEILLAAQPLEFIHPIARAAVYRELAVGERSRIHRTAAAILAEDRAAPQRIATHARACEAAGDPDVVAWLRSAARRAAASGAPDAAVRYLHRALREPPQPELRAEVQFELGSVLIAVDTAEAAEAFRHAARVATDRQLGSRAFRWCGCALAYAGFIADAIASFDKAIELAADPDVELHLATTRDFFAAWWGDMPDRHAFQSRLQRRADRVDGNSPGSKRARAIAAMNICLTGSAPAADALNLVQRAGPVARLAPNLDDGDETAAATALVGIVCDDPRPSIFERSHTEAANKGWILLAARAARSCAILELRRGALQRAEAHARLSWEILAPRRGAATSLYWWSAAVLVDVLIARGALEEADAIVAATDLGEEPMDQVIFPWPPVIRGELDLAHAKTEAGIGRLLRAGAWLDQRGFTNPAYIPWRALAAPAIAAVGRLEEAREVIGPALIRAREFGAPWGLGMALRAAGTVEQGSRGIQLLTEAVGVLEQSPCRLEQARALLELGACLRRTNRRAEARTDLRIALDLADRCGAVHLAVRAEQELLATGARPRRALLSGLGSLTASERRIAELAGAGLSNPEIAQQLFITRKTVETHLGHVYSKLDITSRAQLPEAIRRGSCPPAAPIRARG